MKTGPEWTVWVIVGAGFFASAIPGRAGSTNTNPPSLSGERVSPRVERAERLMGRTVRSTGGERIGRVEDMVVDLDCGRVLYAVVSSGGFLGMGNRRLAIPPGALQAQGAEWRTKLDAKQLTGAPQFTREREGRLEDSGFPSAVYKYFGQATWWEIGDTNSPGPEFNNVHKVSRLIGAEVRDLTDKRIGGVNSLAIDFSASRVVCAVFSADRSLGLSNSLYALPPNALTPSADRKVLTTSIGRDRLVSATGFERDDWPDMSNPSWAPRLYQYYGKQAYFDSGELRPTGRTNAPQRIYHEPR